MKAFTPDQLGIVGQPLDSNEVGQAIIDRRLFLAATIMGQRVLAVAKVQPVYPMPRPLPDQFYGGER